MIKRLVDILASFFGLLVVSPILLPVMFLVWKEDRKSPFYIAPRSGRNGTTFKMVKLRSMIVGADKSGVDSTSDNDMRITPIGYKIRRYKLDELIQLWNVLKGDMSLVGPRPNVKPETDLYTNIEKGLLSVRPGITDFSSIVFSDEGDILEGKIDEQRRIQLAQHHTATHIINTAARRVLGEHINQAGAFKDVDKARIDITHYDSLNYNQIKEIETIANKAIKDKLEVEKEILSKDLAEKRYGFTLYQGGFVPGNEVRVVHVKGFDAQACGGTHLDNTKDLEQIKILGSKRIQDGVIRISYVAGKIAKKLEKEEKKLGSEILLAFGVKSGHASLDEIERAAKILKSQKEHLPKTIARFIKEVDELSGKLKQILPKLKTQPVDEAVTELFTTWKRLRKELKKRRRNS